MALFNAAIMKSVRTSCNLKLPCVGIMEIILLFPQIYYLIISKNVEGFSRGFVFIGVSCSCNFIYSFRKLYHIILVNPDFLLNAFI